VAKLSQPKKAELPMEEGLPAWYHDKVVNLVQRWKALGPIETKFVGKKTFSKFTQ
jgi:hypothetical protein